MTTPKALLKALDVRDGRVCAWHGVSCGVDTLVPQHRANRGMGGRKSGQSIANLVWLCSEANGLIESASGWAVAARLRGIKVSTHDNPACVSVFHAVHGRVFLLDDGTVSPCMEEVA